MFLPQTLLARFLEAKPKVGHFVHDKIRQAQAFVASVVYFFLHTVVIPALSFVGIKAKNPSKKTAKKQQTEKSLPRTSYIRQWLDFVIELAIRLVQPLIDRAQAVKKQVRDAFSSVLQKVVTIAQSFFTQAIQRIKETFTRIISALPFVEKFKTFLQTLYQRVLKYTDLTQYKAWALQLLEAFTARMIAVRDFLFALLANIRKRVSEFVRSKLQQASPKTSIRVWASDFIERVRTFWIKRRPLPTFHVSPWDAIWLEMKDDKTVSGIFNSVLRLDRKLGEDKMGMITLSLLDHIKFRSVVEHPKGHFSKLQALWKRPSPVLREVDKYDEDYHITYYQLDTDISKDEDEDSAYETALNELIDDLINKPLDINKPLWRIHVIKCQDEKRGDVVFIQLHHFIGDATSLVRLILSLTSEDVEGRTKPSLSGSNKQNKCNDDDDDSSVTTPRWKRTHQLVCEIRRIVFTLPLAVYELFIRPSDPKTPLKGNLSATKRVATFNIDMAEVQRISSVHDVEISTVLISAAAGALGEYVTEREAHIEAKGKGKEDHFVTKTWASRLKESIQRKQSKKIHAMISYPLNGELTLANKLSVTFLPLPLNIADPTRCIQAVGLVMDNFRNGIWVNNIFFRALQWGPLQHLLGGAVNYFEERGSLALFNMPGPKRKVHFAGCKVDSFKVLAPLGKFPLGISIFSYNGVISISFASDANVIPDPDRIVHHCIRQFAHLAEQAEPGQN